jgi:hypothetical protein
VTASRASAHATNQEVSAMKKTLLCLAVLCVTLSGCVVVPEGRPRYYGPRVVAEPVVVVAHPGVWVR